MSAISNKENVPPPLSINKGGTPKLSPQKNKLLKSFFDEAMGLMKSGKATFAKFEELGKKIDKKLEDREKEKALQPKSNN